MFLTPEEIYKRKKRKKYIIKFLIIPLVSIAVGGAVAILASLI
ncbi:hypothetical protein [Bacillus solitudinis]|nr:hypothetical protein [Bacillus solitudinis]